MARIFRDDDPRLEDIPESLQGVALVPPRPRNVLRDDLSITPSPTSISSPNPAVTSTLVPPQPDNAMPLPLAPEGLQGAPLASGADTVAGLDAGAKGALDTLKGQPIQPVSGRDLALEEFRTGTGRREGSLEAAKFRAKFGLGVHAPGTVGFDRAFKSAFGVTPEQARAQTGSSKLTSSQQKEINLLQAKAKIGRETTKISQAGQLAVQQAMVNFNEEIATKPGGKEARKLDDAIAKEKRDNEQWEIEQEKLGNLFSADPNSNFQQNRRQAQDDRLAVAQARADIAAIIAIQAEIRAAEAKLKTQQESSIEFGEEGSTRTTRTVPVPGAEVAPVAPAEVAPEAAEQATSPFDVNKDGTVTPQERQTVIDAANENIAAFEAMTDLQKARLANDPRYLQSLAVQRLVRKEADEQAKRALGA